MKVSEVQGNMLDYWVSHAIGIKCYPPANPYSESWELTGPLIEKYQIKVNPWTNWEASCHGKEAKGRTALEAICRVVVMVNIGDEVPDETE